MDAAQGGHIEVVRLLLDRGADLTKGVEKDGHVVRSQLRHDYVDFDPFLRIFTSPGPPHTRRAMDST